MALNIVRVNALPETIAASTIYLVKNTKNSWPTSTWLS